MGNRVILEMNYEEAKSFFLKSESYFKLVPNQAGFSSSVLPQDTKLKSGEATSLTPALEDGIKEVSLIVRFYFCFKILISDLESYCLSGLKI